MEVPACAYLPALGGSSAGLKSVVRSGQWPCIRQSPRHPWFRQNGCDPPARCSCSRPGGPEADLSLACLLKIRRRSVILRRPTGTEEDNGNPRRTRGDARRPRETGGDDTKPAHRRTTAAAVAARAQGLCVMTNDFPRGPWAQRGRRWSALVARFVYGLPAGGSSMLLTCAATTRQPSGKRTQVCIWRLTLPSEPAR
jgi:hypothetical protein